MREVKGLLYVLFFSQEALRNADELLEAEEREKRQAEKKKKRNRKVCTPVFPR